MDSMFFSNETNSSDVFLFAGIVNETVILQEFGSQSEPATNHFKRDEFLIVLYAITGILAFYGNYLVCRIIFDRNSTLKNSTNILVGNLAISDIMCAVSIFSQWFFCSNYALNNWNMEFPCAVTKSMQVLSFYMSSIIMMLIAIERYVAVMYPLRPPLRSKLFVTIAWIAITAFVATSLGSAKVFEYFNGHQIISCRIVLVYQFQIPFFNVTFNSNMMRTQRVWGIWMGQYFLPLLITGILYVIIAKKIWTRKKVGVTSDASKNARDAKKKRIVIMLIVVVVVFTLCWLPLHSLNFTDYVIKKLEKKIGKGRKGKLCNDSTAYFLLYWLGISSCCYNPFIYWWMNPEFRKGFQKLMPKFVTRFMASERPATTTNSIELQIRPDTKATNSS